MKLKDSLSTPAVVDAWRAAIQAEFGVGRSSATLELLEPLVADVVDSPARVDPFIVEFGYRNGSANQGLDFTMRCLEVLASVSDMPLATALDTRSAAVLAAEGWNSGVLGRFNSSDGLLTPIPVLRHLLKQRYVGAEAHPDRIGRRIVIVVVDLRDVIATPIQLRRLRASNIEMLRSVWSIAHPISEGSNGNLVVMVERDVELHASVARLRQMILNDCSPHSDRVRIWIEPLSDAGIHLDSHLESLVGTFDSPRQPLRQAV